MIDVRKISATSVAYKPLIANIVAVNKMNISFKTGQLLEHKRGDEITAMGSNVNLSPVTVVYGCACFSKMPRFEKKCLF